ncbi:MAG TPA: zinc ribbon domain-containing protein [Steroidobacteraceae bacterium]
MPFYEYECSHCRYYAEVMQKITDRPLKKCPSCGRNTFKKLLSAPVFRLKGSGWYETDFKSDAENKRNLAAADKDESATAKDSAKPAATGDATASAAPADGKSDTKPVSKPEAKDSSTGSKGERPAAASKSRTAAGRSRAAAASKVAGKAVRGKSARPARRKSSRRRGGR